MDYKGLSIFVKIGKTEFDVMIKPGLQDFFLLVKLSRQKTPANRKGLYKKQIYRRELPKRRITSYFWEREKKDALLVLKGFSPQAGLALPFPIDEMSMIHRNTNQNEYFPIMRIPFGN